MTCQVRGWVIAVSALFCYCLAIVLSLVAPLSLSCTALMMVFSVITMLLELYYVARGFVKVSRDKHIFRVKRGERLRGMVTLMCRDGGTVLRNLFTTLVPMLLGIYGGVAFLFQVQATEFADACTVANLSAIESAQYLVFSCLDGHVATHMQHDVRTHYLDSYYAALETNESLEQERIQHLMIEAENDSYPVAETDGELAFAISMPVKMRGYVAPLYQQPCRRACSPGLDSLPEGDDIRPCCRDVQPVAWAVNAGQSVVSSSCASFWHTSRERFPSGTCGIFALALQDKWHWFTYFCSFGRSWGYNITHFNIVDMRHAVTVLKARHEHELGQTPDPFSEDALPYVIAQPVETFFGTAYPFSFVCMTLVFVGLFDRTLNLTEYFWRFHQAGSPAKHAHRPLPTEDKGAVPERNGKHR